MTTVDNAEHELVLALRAGDERVFAALVDRYNPMMQRVARGYVATREVAEEVVQDTWLALLEGIDRFEERSSLRTWLFRVLVNIAKTRGVRDRRTTPMSSLFDVDPSGDGPTVDPSRFLPADHPKWPHHWSDPPEHWQDSPERQLLSWETTALVQREIDRLPPQQRLVVSLRDIAGYDSDEVCNVLGLTAANQRVLLHRGRARVRQALDQYLAGR
jgi:RNA polymerase sigma-70 factor (ECF subfamily)